MVNSNNEIKIDGSNNRVYIGAKEKFEPMLDWLRAKMLLHIDNVGNRYTPKLNIRNDFFYDLVNMEKPEVFLDKLKKWIVDARFNYSYPYFKEAFDETAITVFCDSIVEYFPKEHIHEMLKIPEYINDFFNILEQALDDITILYENQKVDNLLNKIFLISDAMNKFLITEAYKNLREKNRHKDDVCQRFVNVVSELKDIMVTPYKKAFSYVKISSNETSIESMNNFQLYRIALTKTLLVTGEALIGKTHLLCDTTVNRFNHNLPTLIFFGQDFTPDKSIISTMISRLGIVNSNEDEFLEALNNLGLEYNTKTLIIIDAINETKESYIWQNGIIGFCNKVKSYPHLALVISIRDVQKNCLVTKYNEEFVQKQIVEVEHRGFEGIEMEAVRTFCSTLGVEFPKVPLHTNRLFVNPGMLFLYIEIIKKTTQKIDTSIINPTAIFKAYIHNLNKDFSQKYSVDEDDRIVEEAINLFISLGTQHDYTHFYIDQKVASRELKLLHVKVLEFLKNEGVLNKYTNSGDTTLYFTYQKFENFFIAEYLLNDFEKNRSIIFDLIKGYNGAITEALFMQIPEKLNKDIFDLNVWLIRDRYICEQYITSLVWRKPNTINDDTFEYLNFLVSLHNLYDNYLDIVLQLSSIPNHPLNIERFHKRLLEFSISERDSFWSIYIHNSFIDESIVKRIIDWAWDKNMDFEINDESLYLYGLTLGWFLTSSNRLLRDSATKALVNIFTNRVNIFYKVLREFESVNDLYVLERLYAVGYGIILRSTNYNGFQELGDYIYQTIFNVEAVVEHILLRDYAKLSVEYINEKLSLNIDLKKVQPPYRSVMPTSYPTNEEIENYRDSLGSGISSIISSMRTESMGFYGDFGRYTFQSNLTNFNLQSIKFQDLSNFAVKVILEEYISDMALFEDVESRLQTHSSSRYDHNIERIGKKYQWMALYKILAIVADNFEIEDSQEWKKVVPYEGTCQTYIRNIDPTTILKSKKEEQDKWWFTLNSDFEDSKLFNVEWMQSNNKLPTVSSLVDIQKDEISYFVQHMQFSINSDEYDGKHRNLYYHMNAFIIEKDSVKDFIGWAQNNNLYGSHTQIPESHHFSEPYLREYPYSKAYDYINTDYYQQPHWQRVKGTSFNILLTSTAYFNEGKSYDKSVSESIEIALPNKWLVEQMQLKQTLNDGEWIDLSGNIVFFDPTVSSGSLTQYDENGILIADKKLLLEFVEKNHLTLVWIMWGEKQVRNVGGNYRKEDFLGIAELQSISYWDGSKIIDEPIKIKFEKRN